MQLERINIVKYMFLSLNNLKAKIPSTVPTQIAIEFKKLNETIIPVCSSSETSLKIARKNTMSKIPHVIPDNISIIDR